MKNNIGDKLIYFENITDKDYTELQNYVLRTGVPSIASHNFRCGTTDEVVIDTTNTTFNNNIVCGGNFTAQTGYTTLRGGTNALNNVTHFVDIV